MGWLFVIYRLDRYNQVKKNFKFLVFLFFAGFLAVIPTSAIYQILENLLSRRIFQNSFGLHFFIVGPTEEFSKFLIFLIATRRLKKLKEPLDGLIFAITIALAFAAIENFLYGLQYGLTTILIRSFLCIAGHMLYSAIWGLITAHLHFQNQNRVSYAVFAVLAAALVHGLYNFLLTLQLLQAAVFLNILGIGVLAIFYFWLQYWSPFKLFAPQDFALAINIIQKALRANPQNEILYTRLGYYYLLGNLPTKARKCWQKMIKRFPHNLYLRLMDSFTVFLFEDRKQGKKLFQKYWQTAGKNQKSAQKAAIKKINLIATKLKKRPQLKGLLN